MRCSVVCARFGFDLSYCASVKFKCLRTVFISYGSTYTLGDVTPFWSLVTRDVLVFFFKKTGNDV